MNVKVRFLDQYRSIVKANLNQERDLVVARDTSF
jgi:hypothetical protein